jgi:hypothetical protein
MNTIKFIIIIVLIKGYRLNREEDSNPLSATNPLVVQGVSTSILPTPHANGADEP